MVRAPGSCGVRRTLGPAGSTVSTTGNYGDMLMNRKKWFLCVTGVLLATLLFGAEAVFAQAPATTASAASARGHDTIRVTWTNAGGETLDKFSVRYQQNTPSDTSSPAAGDFDNTMNIMRMEVKKTSSNMYAVNIDGLMPAKDYVFGITALGAGTNADATEVYAYAMTDAADAPDDVMNLMLTAGDRMIMAMWDATTDNGSPITGYALDYREKGKSTWMNSRVGDQGTESNMDTSTEWTISNLMNDTTYEVRVQACSYDMCGDWTDEEEAKPSAMIPTPALPIFGAFVLGAGLLAAGRRRLHRQRLLDS